MSKVNLLVSVDDQHLARISEVSEDLQSAGMNVEDVKETTGVIVGSADSEKIIQKLSQVEGVSSVEPEREIEILPQGSDIQ